jgi:hypothetical protein
VIVVVDTNVLLVANGQHEDVGDTCVAKCSRRLSDIRKNDRVAIDDGYEILREYQKKTNHKTGRRPGDAFLKWLLRNNSNPRRCVQVHLTPHADRSYISFPDDARLAGFDPADRKFVAVAAAHPENPPVLQAADSKWHDWSGSLREHGVEVEFLCPDDTQRFRRQKAGA